MRIRPQKMAKMTIFMDKNILNPLPRAEYGHFSRFLRTDSQIFVRQIFAKSFRIHCGSKMCSNRSELSIARIQKWFGMYIFSIEIWVSLCLLRIRLKNILNFSNLNTFQIPVVEMRYFRGLWLAFEMNVKDLSHSGSSTFFVLNTNLLGVNDFS